MARQLTDEELQAQSTTLSPAGMLTRPNEGSPELDAFIAKQNAEIAATRAGGKGSPDHDGAGYLLDPATGQRATVGNRAAVLAAIAASRPEPEASTGMTAADEWNAAFDARQRESKLLNEDDRLRNLNPQQRLQEQEVRAGRAERFRQDQFDYARHQDAIHNDHAQKELHLRNATTASELAARKIGSETAISEQLDTAGFLLGQHDIALSDPQYEEKSAANRAAHPHVPPSVVNMHLASVGDKRAGYLKAAQLGGSAEFTGPAQDAYNEAYQESKDPAFARAKALNTAGGEKFIHEAQKDGLLLPEHLDPNSKNSFVSKDGRVDYEKARTILDNERGKVEGVQIKNNRADAAEDLRLFHATAPQPGKPPNPDNDAIHAAVRARIAQRERDKAAAASGNPNAVAPLPPKGAAALTRY